MEKHFLDNPARALKKAFQIRQYSDPVIYDASLEPHTSYAWSQISINDQAVRNVMERNFYRS